MLNPSMSRETEVLRFETLDPYSLGALVFLRPVDTGVLFGTGDGAAGVLLLFTEGYMSREQTP